MKIGLVVYDFGTKSVGGQRWYFIVEELKKLDVDVQVFGFNSDIQMDETLNSVYPSSLLRVPSSVLDKVSYRIAKRRLQKKVKGNFFDKSILDGQCVRQLVPSNPAIDLWIGSGAPFNLVYSLSQSAHLNGKKVLIDLRDPWTYGWNHGQLSLSEERKIVEVIKEKDTFESASGVLFASNDLKRKYADLYPKYKSKMFLLENSVRAERADFWSQDRKNAVHIGTVNAGTEQFWRPLLKSISNGEIDEIEQLHFIGGVNLKVKNFVKENGLKNIVFLPSLPRETLYSTLHEYKLGVAFKRLDLPDSIPTKIFDYMTCGLPILVGTKPGRVSRLIKRLKIGEAYEVWHKDVVVDFDSLVHRKDIYDYISPQRRAIQLLSIIKGVK